MPCWNSSQRLDLCRDCRRAQHWPLPLERRSRKVSALRARSPVLCVSQSRRPLLCLPPRFHRPPSRRPAGLFSDPHRRTRLGSGNSLDRSGLCTVARVSAWRLPPDYGLGLDNSPAAGQGRRRGASMGAQDARLRRAPARRTPGLRRKVPQQNDIGEAGASAGNFIRSIIASDVETGRTPVVVTRFPPEPNGFLHLGHAKSIVLNYELAKEFGGRCNLRLDDTNPAKERMEYIDAIKRDVQWLGFDWRADARRRVQERRA